MGDSMCGVMKTGWHKKPPKSFSMNLPRRISLSELKKGAVIMVSDRKINSNQCRIEFTVLRTGE